MFAFTMLDYISLSPFNKNGTAVSEFVTLEAGVFEQGLDENGVFYSETKFIDLHPCTQAELQNFY